MKILVVEDNNDINNLVKEILESKYEITQSFSGTECLRILETDYFDLIVMDLMLPGLNGEEIIPIIKEKYNIPIIVITAKVGVDNLVEVLSMGADDYIPKPFNNKELLARVEVRLRNPQETKETGITVGDLRWQPDIHTILCQEKPLVLTQKELAILIYMMKDPLRVYTKENLYEHVWEETYYGDDNTISVHISRLRHKLQEVQSNVELETIWGIGFKLKI